MSARQILSENRIYLHRDLAMELGIEDEDWVLVESRNGKLKCRARLMDGVNPHTVWTWNAIGKRSGAWALDKDAPESRIGFLLNHLISEYLPTAESGRRIANADPVTGQAAWFDLTVRIERSPPGETDQTFPHMPPITPPFMVSRPHVLRFGAKRKFARGRRND